MKRAKIRRARRLGGGYSDSWACYVSDDPSWMRGVASWHPTYAAALAHALHEVGLTPTNPEEQQ